MVYNFERLKTNFHDKRILRGDGGDKRFDY